MSKIIFLLTFLILGSTPSFAQDNVKSAEWKGKSYFVYPYGYSVSPDYSYNYKTFGADESEREIVPYPGNLPDGDYIMYYEDVSKYKKKMWFFHRRGIYYFDTTVVAAVFSIKNNQKQGKVEFYSSYDQLVETGTYTNNQKEGVWFRNGYFNSNSYYKYGSDPKHSYNFPIGSKLEMLTYKNGIREGKYRVFYDPKQPYPSKFDTTQLEIVANGYYKLNTEFGKWTYYYINSKIDRCFFVSDSVRPKTEFDPIIYGGKLENYHGWYESYYDNGQLQNRILYEYGIKKQVDTAYYYNGKFNIINAEKKVIEDTLEVVYRDYIIYDTLESITSHSYFKDNQKLWTKYYSGGVLCNETYDVLYYIGFSNKDTLLPITIYYDCYNTSEVKKIDEIYYKHFPTGATLVRKSNYFPDTYYESNDDFELKSDTASHIYYITEIDFRGENKELEFKQYSHYYRGPYYSFYHSYTQVIDSIVIFKNGNRFTGELTEYFGTWKKKTGKVKVKDKSIKIYSYEYGGRDYGGDYSFGYSSKRSKKFAAYYGGRRNYRHKFGRKLQNTTRGYYSDGLKQGKWINKEKRSGKINVLENYEKGKMNGEQREYSIERIYKWSDCIDIVDKKISKRIGFFRRQRYYLAFKENYVSDALDGEQFEYYCSGRMSEKSNYKDGSLDGTYQMFSESGAIVREVNYSDGFIDGKYQEWFPTKKFKYDLIFEQGLMVGEYKLYYFNGNILTQGSLDNGYRIGEWLTYFEEGNLKYKEIYTMADSSYSYFAQSGTKFSEYRTHQMNSCYSMQYYPSGVLAAEGKILRDKRADVWKFYDEGSNLIRQINYNPGFIKTTNSNGKIDSLYYYGTYESWYSNGIKQAEGYVLKELTKYDCYQEVNISLQDLFYNNYWDREGVQTIKNCSGRLKSYHLITGAVESEGELVEGKKTGYWRYWDPQSKLTSVGNYKNDLQEGRWLSGDLEGMHYLEDACFDMSDPRVIEDMEIKKKLLYINETIYLKGEIIKQTDFKVDLNK